jgi:hypothetical protein
VPPPPRRRGLPPRRHPDNNRVHLPGSGPDIPSERAPHEVGVRQPSLSGNFAELGPYLLGNSTGLTRNPDVWRLPRQPARRGVQRARVRPRRYQGRAHRR